MTNEMIIMCDRSRELLIGAIFFYSPFALMLSSLCVGFKPARAGLRWALFLAGLAGAIEFLIFSKLGSEIWGPIIESLIRVGFLHSVSAAVFIVEIVFMLIWMAVGARAGVWVSRKLTG